MIIGDNRIAVIENIRQATKTQDFYSKVEINDPVLTKEQSKRIVNQYLENRNKVSFRIKSFAARKVTNIATKLINKETEIVGFEKLANISGGAFITSNHFSPVENTIIRKMVRKLGKKRLNIISQVTNLAMPGVIGFLMNYADTIPIYQDAYYMKKGFISVLGELIKKDEMILIYPEQEMWFNYRKPRPIKRGAYYFAASLNAPVISCFVEMKELDEKDTEEFNKLKYVLHILDVIYPDSEKSIRENSIIMAEKDYSLKKEAYESIYGKTLKYDFEPSDIAGWRR